MAKTQKYGIKFPTTIESELKTLVDLNLNPLEDIKSQLMHLIFTPQGQRIRKPTFGTQLIQFLFNPNDSQSWGDITREIKDKVAKNVPNCSINNIDIFEGEDGRELIAKISFTVTYQDVTFNDELVTNL